MNIYRNYYWSQYLTRWYKSFKSLPLEQILTPVLMKAGHKRILQYWLYLKSSLSNRKRKEEEKVNKSESRMK